MDIDKIFNTFAVKDPEDNHIKDKNWTDHPYYWVMMFVKIMANYKAFGEKFISVCKNIDVSLDLKDMREAGEYFAYERAWFYISKINPEYEDHIRAINNQIDLSHLDKFDLIINYYQEREEYERCAHILNIKKILLF